MKRTDYFTGTPSFPCGYLALTIFVFSLERILNCSGLFEGKSPHPNPLPEGEGTLFGSPDQFRIRSIFCVPAFWRFVFQAIGLRSLVMDDLKNFFCRNNRVPAIRHSLWWKDSCACLVWQAQGHPVDVRCGDNWDHV